MKILPFGACHDGPARLFLISLPRRVVYIYISNQVLLEHMMMPKGIINVQINSHYNADCINDEGMKYIIATCQICTTLQLKLLNKPLRTR